jgi:hypothetical protein
VTFPALQKSWQFNVNNAYGPGATSLEKHQQAMGIMKTAMTTGFSNPWTVHSSCIASKIIPPESPPQIWLYGPGDFWSGPSWSQFLFTDGSNHPWIVFNAPVGGGQLLFDLYSGTSNCVTIWSGSGLFTGGSPDAAPEAADGQVIYGYGFGAQQAHGWLDARNYASSGQIHMIHSTDGEVSMFLCCAGGTLSGVWLFCKAADPEPGWLSPYVFYSLDCADSSRESLTYTEGLVQEGGILYPYGHSKIENVAGLGYPFNMGFCSEGTKLAVDQSEPIGEKWAGANGISGLYPMTPLYFASFDIQDALGAVVYNAGVQGVIGRVPDIYATAESLNTGHTFDSASWAVMGNVVIPWDGSTPVVT